MQEQYNAKEILDQIIQLEQRFLINNDPALTEAAETSIINTDWEKVKMDNPFPLSIDTAAISSTNSTPQPPTAPIEYHTDMSWYYIYADILNENKDITHKIPTKTRLRFVKRILNKLMKVCTRYQESFNNAVYALFSGFGKKIQQNEKSIFEVSNLLKALEQKVSEQTTQVITQYVQQIEELTRKSNEMSVRLDETMQKLDRTTAEMDETARELDETTQKLGETSRELYEMSQHVSESEQKIIILSQEKAALSELCTKIQQGALASSEHAQGIEKWLESVAGRVNGLEAWLSATNKRVDSCNELLSAAPEIAYSSYSQSGEDIIISYLLSNLQAPLNDISYLDIGSNHYKNYNNTFRLYQKGHSGVLVEANPDMIAELKKFRPRDVVLNNGIGTEDGRTLDFYVIGGGGLSSFNKEFIDRTLSHSKDAFIEKIIPVQIISVERVISQYFDHTPEVVSIDIEGGELDVLQSIDFTKIRPFIFVVETIEYREGLAIDIKRSDIVDYMLTQGYYEYAFTGINSIFIDKNRI